MKAGCFFIRMILNVRNDDPQAAEANKLQNVYLSGRLAAPRAACRRRAFWAQMRCRGGAAGARSVCGHRTTAARRQIRQDFLVSLATSFRLRFQTVYRQRLESWCIGHRHILLKTQSQGHNVVIEHESLAQGVIRINITLYEWPVHVHALWIVSNLLCKQSILNKHNYAWLYVDERCLHKTLLYVFA